MEREREAGKKSKKSFVCWFTLQMAGTARAEPESPTGVRKTQELNPSSDTFHR